MAYHINKKGLPGICKAEKGKCPYGEHYETEEQAVLASDVTSSLFEDPDGLKVLAYNSINRNIDYSIYGKNDLERAVEEIGEYPSSDLIRESELIVIDIDKRLVEKDRQLYEARANYGDPMSEAVELKIDHREKCNQFSEFVKKFREDNKGIGFIQPDTNLNHLEKLFGEGGINDPSSDVNEKSYERMMNKIDESTKKELNEWILYEKDYTKKLQNLADRYFDTNEIIQLQEEIEDLGKSKKYMKEGIKKLKRSDLTEYEIYSREYREQGLKALKNHTPKEYNQREVIEKAMAVDELNKEIKFRTELEEAGCKDADYRFYSTASEYEEEPGNIAIPDGAKEYYAYYEGGVFVDEGKSKPEKVHFNEEGVLVDDKGREFLIGTHRKYSDPKRRREIANSSRKLTVIAIGGNGRIRNYDKMDLEEYNPYD